MLIRTLTVPDRPFVLEIAKRLPEWFTSGGIEILCKDLENQHGLVACLDKELIGFLIYKKHSETFQINWMGVDPQAHRQGVGQKLLMEICDLAVAQDIERILVSTLGDSVDYEPYERTRAFYRKYGFKDYQRNFHPENPEQEEELILALAINPDLKKEIHSEETAICRF